MKKLITLAFALSFVLYVSNLAAHAQGRGSGRGPSVSAGHAPDVDHGKSADHGKPADHDQSSKSANTNKDAKHNATFEERFAKNPDLKTRLSNMLPAGMDLNTARSGFKNDGQFIAALHVSKNLNIPFADLKAKMLGTAPAPAAGTTATSTPTSPTSLGGAIHALKPTIPESEVKVDVETAEKEAKADLKTTKPIS